MTEPNRLNGLHTDESPSDVPAAAAPSHPVIVLDDRTVGPESEIHRLKSQLFSVTSKLDQARSENDKLREQLIEIRHVLAKVELKDLRAFERVTSWMRSFRL
jgi:hypothetical protein